MPASADFGAAAAFGVAYRTAYHAVRSVAEGRGFSFNGHVVYGDTSPLWVWLLVIGSIFLYHSAQLF